MQVRFLPPQLIVSLESDVGSQQRSTGRIHPAPDSRLPTPVSRHTTLQEVIRPDEEPVSKTGAGAKRPLWVRVPRLPP